MVSTRVGYLLKRAQLALRARMDEALCVHKLTTPQYAALASIQEAPGISNAELARRSFVTPQTMVRILDNLVGMKLIRRESDPNHGRILRSRLTRQGAKTLAACHSNVLGVEKRMLSPLSSTERRQLADFLERCSCALEGSAPR